MNKALATTFAALLSIDGILTYWAVSSGQFQEANPLMAPIAGSPVFIVYKVATAILAVLVIGWLTHRFPRLRKVTNAGLCIFSLFYVFILGSNLVEVFQTI